MAGYYVLPVGRVLYSVGRVLYPASRRLLNPITMQVPAQPAYRQVKSPDWSEEEDDNAILEDSPDNLESDSDHAVR